MPELALVCKQATYVVDVTGHRSEIFYTPAKATLRVQSPGLRISYLYFPVPPDLVGKTPTLATVRVKANTTAAFSVSLQRHAKPKTAYSKMTANNDPGVLAGSVAVPGVQDVGDPTWWSFDVMVDAVSVAGGGAHYGARLTTTSTTARAFYGPNTEYPPTMYLNYTAAPPTPTGVSPHGGVVSVAKPWITWPTGDDITGVRAQVALAGGAWNDATGFTSPIFDTGWVASTTPQVNLAATAYSGFANTGTQDYAISVAQQNAEGASDWSDPGTVGYATRPAYGWGSPDPTSGDPTPPHVVTGTPVTSWQMFTRNAATGALYWNSGLTPGDDATATPDKGPTTAGTTVVSTARLWDRPDRIASVGQPAYTEITLPWTYTPNSSGDSFVGGHVTQVDGTPAVRWWCQWTGTLPDEIIVERDGVRVTRFDFDENVVSAGAWSGVDWSCPPNTRDVEYRFVPVINNVAQKAYVTRVTTTVEGYWLVDPTDGTWVTFYGTGGTKAAAESSAVYVPLSGGRVIVRTSGHRGIEGDVQVSLYDYEADEVRDLAARFAVLKKRATTTTLRQIGGRSNFEVACLNMNLVDDDDNMLTDQDVRVVSWTFYQADYPDDADGLDNTP